MHLKCKITTNKNEKEQKMHRCVMLYGFGSLYKKKSHEVIILMKVPYIYLSLMFSYKIGQ